jgi:hypothetical protein
MCVVKDQQVGPFCSSFVYVAIKFFFNSVGRIKSMDSSSTKDMNFPAISGDMLAAVASSGSTASSKMWNDNLGRTARVAAWAA